MTRYECREGQPMRVTCDCGRFLTEVNSSARLTIKCGNSKCRAENLINVDFPPLDGLTSIENCGIIEESVNEGGDDG